MNNVSYLLGTADISPAGHPIFAPETCAFLAGLSKAILKNPQAKTYPDLISFAFWIRKSNLLQRQTAYAAETDRLGKGICFHIAPANIPINFAFSYVFGLLAGNSNIVRLPSKNFPQVGILLEIIAEILPQYPTIQTRTAFVQYPRTSTATADFSKLADARMIWGGNATIQQVRSLPTKPRGTDIAFADRYSIGLINAEELLKLDDPALHQLAEGFYNDTYLMDQNACSSPQLLFWLNDSPAAREKFWQAVTAVASQKYELQGAVAVDKFTQACADAIDLPTASQTTTAGNLLYRVELADINNEIEHLRGKGGYFYEHALQDTAKLFPLISDTYQTVTYFGLNPEDIRQQIIQHKARGIDRIVPIGKAMDIDIVWDGHDLIRELSRKITTLN